MKKLLNKLNLGQGLYFDDLKKYFPKSFELVIKSFQIDDSLLEIRYHSNDWLRHNLLYFFDAQEIYIDIFTDLYMNPTTFCYSIRRRNENRITSGKIESRNKAEQLAFLKSFEILEQKI
ncbi:hypothetical protein [Immundisolibacter sp.]